MTPRPDAKENRRLGKIENYKAEALRDGPVKKAHLKKARDYEDEAHSNDWRLPPIASPLKDFGTNVRYLTYTGAMSAFGEMPCRQ